MVHWYSDLARLWHRVWEELDLGVRDPKMAARSPVLATLGLGGAPEARTVVLRDACREEARLAIHTDSRSTKCAELAAHPKASLHIWEPRMRLQTRLRGHMAVETGAAVAWLWGHVPDGSRASYGVTPAPGTPIETADAYQSAPDPSRFAVLTLTIEEIDAVHLSGDHHRRALFRREDNWRGTWLAP